MYLYLYTLIVAISAIVGVAGADKVLITAYAFLAVAPRLALANSKIIFSMVKSLCSLS